MKTRNRKSPPDPALSALADRLAPLGNATCLEVVASLVAHGPGYVAEIARRVGIAEHAAHNAVDRLESAGFVAREFRARTHVIRLAPGSGIEALGLAFDLVNGEGPSSLPIARPGPESTEGAAA